MASWATSCDRELSPYGRNGAFICCSKSRASIGSLFRLRISGERGRKKKKENGDTLLDTIFNRIRFLRNKFVHIKRYSKYFFVRLNDSKENQDNTQNRRNAKYREEQILQQQQIYIINKM